MIAELDEKKREALERTWRKVNADFGSIFAMLLPGTSAKLEPPEGGTFLDGARRLLLPALCSASQRPRHCLLAGKSTWRALLTCPLRMQGWRCAWRLAACGRSR